MQSMKESKILYYSLIGCFVFCVILSTELIPSLNQWLQLVPLPNKSVYSMNRDVE